MAPDIEAECRRRIRQCLETLTDALCQELRAIIADTYSETAYCLWFEYDSPHFYDSFPVMFCVLDRSGEAEVRRELLPNIAGTVPAEVLDDPRYESEDENTWNLSSKVLEVWFADCWEYAGGHQSRLPGYIAHHDSAYAFSLSDRRQLRDPQPEFPDKVGT